MKKLCINCGVMFKTAPKSKKTLCPKCEKRMNDYDVDPDVIETFEDENIITFTMNDIDKKAIEILNNKSDTDKINE
jgi:predicted  nucleic acid-binding Zn-ribbon protein